MFPSPPYKGVNSYLGVGKGGVGGGGVKHNFFDPLLTATNSQICSQSWIT